MPIINLINTAFSVYKLLLIIRIIMSWIPLPSNPALDRVAEAIYAVTEPFLSIFRRLLPMANLGGVGMDFSPLIAFIVLGLVQQLVMGMLVPTFG